jgi:hypothetical protein
MVLDHRHGKGINTVLTPRIESTLEVKISRLVATSLLFLITIRRNEMMPLMMSRV